MKTNFAFQSILAGLTLLMVYACSTATPPLALTPSPVPFMPTPVVLISQQVTLVSVPYAEAHQNPLFSIRSQIPQLKGSNDSRVQALNQILDQTIQREIQLFRDEFLLYSAKPLPSGSSMDGSYVLTAQYADIWSFKLDFLYYYDNPRIPVHFSIPINHDLAQGKTLLLSDLFLSNSNYLELISEYCITELKKRNTTDNSIYGATYPNAYIYENWNIMPQGLMVTFNQTEVAPSEAGLQMVLVPYNQLQSVMDPSGPLGKEITNKIP